MNPQIQKISEQIIDVAFKMGRVYQQEQISEEEKREIAESEDKTYDPHGKALTEEEQYQRDEMIENQIDDSIEEKHREREREEGIAEDKVSKYRDCDASPED